MKSLMGEIVHVVRAAGCVPGVVLGVVDVTAERRDVVKVLILGTKPLILPRVQHLASFAELRDAEATYHFRDGCRWAR